MKGSFHALEVKYDCFPATHIGLLRAGNRLSNFAITRYTPDALASEHQTEPIFDEPQVLASDHSLAGQLRRSTALGPVEILLGTITFWLRISNG
jgi:hypothetical protein